MQMVFIENVINPKLLPLYERAGYRVYDETCGGLKSVPPRLYKLLEEAL